MSLILCSGLPWICGRLEGGSSASRSSKFGVVVLRHLCSSEGVNLSYIHAPLLHLPCQLTIDPCYTITPFPLPIDHRSMLHHYTQEVCPRYLCIMLYMKLIWCNGFPEISAHLKEGVGSICHGYIYALFYIYTSAKFGVVVLKASMLNCLRSICHGYMYTVLYIYIDLPSLV